jgi:hypothetical protein
MTTEEPRTTEEPSWEASQDPGLREVINEFRSTLDAIPGGAIEAAGEILVEWPIAIYTVSDSATTIFNSLRGTRCRASRVLDVSGGGVTRANGEAVIRLKDVTCAFPVADAGGSSFSAGPPINVVATARRREAIHLTVSVSLQPHDRDAEIRVFAWDPTGQPVGGAAFYWRCTVSYVESAG